MLEFLHRWIRQQLCYILIYPMLQGDKKMLGVRVPFWFGCGPGRTKSFGPKLVDCETW